MFGSHFVAWWFRHQEPFDANTTSAQIFAPACNRYVAPMDNPVDVSDRRRVPLTVRRVVLVGVVVTAAAITLGPLAVSILDTTHDVVRWMVSLIPDAPVGRPRRTETEAMLNVAAPVVIVCAVAWWRRLHLRCR